MSGRGSVSSMRSSFGGRRFRRIDCVVLVTTINTIDNIVYLQGTIPFLLSTNAFQGTSHHQNRHPTLLARSVLIFAGLTRHHF